MKVSVTLETPAELEKFISLVKGDEDPEEKPKKRGRGRPPKKKDPDEDPEPEEKPKKTRKKKSKKSDAVTLRQLRKAANDYSKENGPDDIEELLEEYEIDSLNDLEESDYAEFLAKIAELE
ncbi:hypothetical protein GWN42_13475 [candidate division KSB1 bacterium]|nr:hypothetical protein [candidate division KSB1 bacterium]